MPVSPLEYSAMRHHTFVRPLAAFTALFLAACSSSSDSTSASSLLFPSTLAEVQQSFSTPDPVVVVQGAISTQAITGLRYATRSPSEQLDLHLPTTGKGPFPVVLWIHGGGWRSGSRSLPSNSAQLSLVANGIAVASIDYRLSQQAIFPAQIQDVKAAVRWLRANATRYNLDPARIGAWGASAGGHLAALLGTSAGAAQLSDPSLGNAMYSDRVSAVVDFFGPVAFRAMDAQLASNGCKLYAGTGHAAASSPPSLLVGAPINTVPAIVTSADPRTYLGAGDAAMLIQHGTTDCQVPHQQSSGLRNAFAKFVKPANVTYQAMAGYGHGDKRFYSASNLAKVVSFFKANL